MADGDAVASDAHPMSAPLTPSDPASHLEEVLEREVSFRLQAIQDARVAADRIGRLEYELEEARQELGRRNSYIHQLHQGQASEKAAREELITDLGEFVRMLQKAEDERTQLERRSHRWSEGWAVVGRATKSLFKPNRANAPESPSAPAGDFTYYLYTSPFRIIRTPQILLRGWCYATDGRPITALRVRVNDLEYPGKWGLEEPEVLKVHTALAPDARPGFEVAFPTPPGRHRLSLEVCLDHREWRSVFVTPIWVRS
jgi:hypothetical protein